MKLRLRKPEEPAGAAGQPQGLGFRVSGWDRGGFLGFHSKGSIRVPLKGSMRA